jgi:tRNA pseudouridine55 synthase
MGNRRGGRPIHGWLVIDKPLGMTSSQVVGAARRATGAAKAGHGGTLDPLASGVLPVALGEATKTVAWAMAGSKTYRFTLRWGEARTTDDREGEVTERSERRPDRPEIVGVLPRFTGEILQVPPAFSAIKVEGRRAYALARAAESVVLAPRPVRIDRLALLAQPDADHAVFEAVVGKGTYIRALGRDLALALGTVAHVAELRRTVVGRFAEAGAITLETLATLGHSARLSEHLLPVETALDDIPALALTEAEAERLRHGQSVALPTAEAGGIDFLEQGAVIRASTSGKLVALAAIEGDRLRPVRVLNH